MKKLLLVLIFLVTVFSVSAACEDKVACKNQDDNLFCLPTDTTCEYVTYDNGCTQLPSTDTDVDEDGWTDKCDAFPEDFTEWIDIDGDSFGYNYDCDDFNFSITEECYDIEINDTDDNETEQNESESEEGSGDGGNDGGSGEVFCTATWDCTDWSPCEDGEIKRTCTKTNDCNDEENKPDEVRACPIITELSLSQKSTDDNGEDNKGVIDRQPTPEEPEQNETQDGGIQSITGQAFNVFDGNFGSGNMLLLLLAILLLFLFFWKRRKKDEEE